MADGSCLLSSYCARLALYQHISTYIEVSLESKFSRFTIRVDSWFKTTNLNHSSGRLKILKCDLKSAEILHIFGLENLKEIFRKSMKLKLCRTAQANLCWNQNWLKSQINLSTCIPRYPQRRSLLLMNLLENCWSGHAEVI